MKFEFRILDDNGDELASGFATFDPKWIGEFGDCEAIDMQTASTLRFIRRQALKRAEAA